MALDKRVYHTLPNELSMVTNNLSQTYQQFQKFMVVYKELDRTKQLNVPKGQVRLKKLADDLFAVSGASIKNSFVKNVKLADLGMTKPQKFMYPLGKDKIVKFDFSKGDVRDIHIYDLNDGKCYSISQSTKNVTFAISGFQRIYEILEMEDNWKRYFK